MIKRYTRDDLQPAPTDTVSDRWGEAADAGFVPVPNILVRAQHQLELSCNDLVVLLNILLHWWHKDRLPHPRSMAIAKRTGLGHRTVQRSISNLEAKGLVARVRSADGNIQYDLAQLRAKLGLLAQDDVWFRPGVVRKHRPANGMGDGAGLQNPNP